MIVNWIFVFNFDFDFYLFEKELKCMKMLRPDQELGLIVTFTKLLRPHGFLALHWYKQQLS